MPSNLPKASKQPLPHNSISDHTISQFYPDSCRLRGPPHKSCRLYPMMNIVTGRDVEIAFKFHLQHGYSWIWNIVGTNMY